VASPFSPAFPADWPEPDAAAKRHGEQVRERIAKEIEHADGWITFARYMELALYAPGLGYYMAGSAKLGEAGDFVTAPEISPLFGETLAGQVAQCLAAPTDEVLELGAGSGRLAAQVLLELQALDRLPARYLILEISPELAQRQRELLARLCPGLVDRVTWISALPARFEGVVLANEVLDALPVHLLHWKPEGVHERGVGWDNGSIVWDDRLLGRGVLRDAAQGVAVTPPYLSEISLASRALVAALAECLQRGILLFIDYGFGRREYYHPQRCEGTLMCHYRHRAHADPLFLPGLQDITAHVDFTAVAEAGIDAGLKLLGYATQARFLLNAGLLQRLEQRGAQNPAPDNVSYLPAVAGVQKLLSPAEMGELFKVMALGRGEVVAPTGFVVGDLSRTL
jgi:SAM-dependent MidA family methyltransferase